MTRRPLYEQHVSGPALAAFLRVSAAWRLDEPQERMLLGQPSPETLRNWKQNRTGALSLDQVERISYVLRIFRLLQEKHGSAGWLVEPRQEPIFGGRRPIDVMCLEDIRGLRQVAQFLDAPGEGAAAEIASDEIAAVEAASGEAGGRRGGQRTK